MIVQKKYMYATYLLKVIHPMQDFLNNNPVSQSSLGYDMLELVII